MRLVALIAALALAGCGGQSQTADNADEALAEAERANNRAADLELELEALRAELESETANRQSEILDVQSEISNVQSELQDLENRVPY